MTLYNSVQHCTSVTATVVLRGLAHTITFGFSAPQPSASLDLASNQLLAGPSGPNVMGLTVVGHGIAGSLVGRAMVDGAIERNVGLALLAVAF
jgi:hypothetical protein